MKALKDLEFAVVSGRIIISDPCYEINSGLNCDISAKKGHGNPKLITMMKTVVPT